MDYRIIKPILLPYLTLKDEVDINERFYTDSVYLGKYDSEDNYREASEEEKQEFENSILNI